jgi:hypothetical protein
MREQSVALHKKMLVFARAEMIVILLMSGRPVSVFSWL